MRLLQLKTVATASTCKMCQLWISLKLTNKLSRLEMEVCKKKSDDGKGEKMTKNKYPQAAYSKLEYLQESKQAFNKINK